MIVVPTIALIDETRRRLSKFKNIYKIITHISQKQEEKNIFVFTQERVVDYPDFPKLDLFILDEFYKLDPQRDQDRAMILNHAFYKLTKLSRQFYLLGPNINAIPDGFPKKFTCTFVRTDYITVVTEIINVDKPQGLTDLEVLGELCKKTHGETLIFCKSPAQARKIVKYLIDSFEEKVSEAANWVAEHYHPEWSFVRGLKHGIGMHHGKIPRALAQLCVREFNNGQLKFLVCTSTLIEGVNTKAKNIIIFDNKISTKKIDFFTFNNIRGRSGRMFKHFIGNVYLFHPEPYAELPLVDLPIFTQESSNARDSLLIQIDDIDLVPTAKERMEPFKRQRILSMDVIKANSGIEPSIQIRLAEYLKVNTDILEQLIWDQTPSWEELVVLCDLILNFLASSKNGLTDKKLAYQIEQLKKKSIQEIIRDKITYKVKKEEIDVADKAVEETLEFVRTWAQFNFPRYAMVICRIVNDIRKTSQEADYSFYVAQVENLFFDSAIITLDEFGIPLPLAQKLELQLNSKDGVDEILEKLRQLDLTKIKLSSFEIELIQNTLSSV